MNLRPDQRREQWWEISDCYGPDVPRPERSLPSAFDVARAIDISGSLPFPEAWPLAQLVLDLGGGPVLAKGKEAPLDVKAVKALVRRGLIDRGGEQATQRATVRSFLDLSNDPTTWTVQVSIGDGGRFTEFVSASDEGIALVAKWVGILQEETPSEPDLEPILSAASIEDAMPNLIDVIADTSGLLTIVFARSDVERRDLSAFNATFEALMSLQGRRRMRQLVGISFEGYDDDPRELFEVPEVVQFVEDIDKLVPWAYFLMSEYGGLKVIFGCLVGVRRVAGGFALADPGYARMVARRLIEAAVMTGNSVGFDGPESVEMVEAIGQNVGFGVGDLEGSEAELFRVAIGSDIWGAEDAERLATELTKMLMPDPATIRRLRARVELTFYGMPDDGRPAWVVPAIARTMRDLDYLWPYGPYFFSREGTTLQTLQYSVGRARPYTDPDGSTQIAVDTQYVASRFAGTWIAAIERLCEQTGSTKDETTNTWKSAVRYLARGPLKG